MKKITALLLALLMLVGALAGCGKQNDTNKTDKLSIVTTIFPEYDWVREILGDKADNAEVTMLLDNGVDLHSYQPTADDIVKISDCDLFIYVGGESDGWVDDALKNATNKNMRSSTCWMSLATASRPKKWSRVCRKQSTITTMTTARKSPPLKMTRFRTEACLIGRATGSLPIPLCWTERWMMRLQRWQRKAK